MPRHTAQRVTGVVSASGVLIAGDESLVLRVTVSVLRTQGWPNSYRVRSSSARLTQILTSGVCGLSLDRHTLFDCGGRPTDHNVNNSGSFPTI